MTASVKKAFRKKARLALAGAFGVAAIGLGIHKGRQALQQSFQKNFQEAFWDAFSPPGWDTTGIGDLRADFSRTEMGRDLLEHIDAHKIVIGYNAKSCINAGNAAQYLFYLNGPDTIEIRPGMGRDNELISFSHEGFHVFQDKTLALSQLENAELKPEEAWAHRQYLEGDAAARSALYWADRAHRLKKEITVNDESGPVIQWASALKKEIDGDGLTVDEYRRLAFEPAMFNLGDYLHGHMDLVTKKNQRLDSALMEPESLLAEGNCHGAKKTLDWIAARQRKTPADAAFEKHLRYYGGMTLDTSDATALENVDRHTLMHGLPNASVDQSTPDNILMRLREETQKRAEIDARYAALRMKINGQCPPNHFRGPSFFKVGPP